MCNATGRSPPFLSKMCLLSFPSLEVCTNWNWCQAGYIICVPPLGGLELTTLRHVQCAHLDVFESAAVFTRQRLKYLA